MFTLRTPIVGHPVCINSSTISTSVAFVYIFSGCLFSFKTNKAINVRTFIVGLLRLKAFSVMVCISFHWPRLHLVYWNLVAKTEMLILKIINLSPVWINKLEFNISSTYTTIIYARFACLLSIILYSISYPFRFLYVPISTKIFHLS